MTETNNQPSVTPNSDTSPPKNLPHSQPASVEKANASPPPPAVPPSAQDIPHSQPASVEKANANPVPAVSPTAKDTHDQDPLRMGRTAGQRTAEVFAGLRAELMRTPETAALARMSGRITARMIRSLGSQKVLNFVPVRLGSFTGLIKQTLGKEVAGKVLVEIAAGFSPRGLVLAREMPDLQVIEIDLPDVILEKQKRLEKAKIAIPPNLTWKSADLGVQPLAEVLDQKQVDIVTAEGLMPYFEHADITRIAGNVYKSLKPGGVFIADLGFTDLQGAQEASALVQMFRRYTNSTPGSVGDEETAYRLFRDAGYEAVELYRMPQTAALFDLPQPVSDVIFFMVSHRKAG